MTNISFAIIGCGKIARRHVDAIRKCQSATLVAVCDKDETRAKALGVAANVPYYDDYQQMFSTHPEIAVVNLMTPSGVHFEQCADIITRFKKHIVIEKPMVLTLAAAQQLKLLAAEHQVRLFPVYQHRFNRAVKRVKQAIGNANELGRLRVGTIRVRWCRPQRYYDLSSWRGTWAMDGGALTNQGIHFIDLLRYLGGEVKAVHAKLATLGANIEVEDTATAILEFASGALGVIEIMTSARPDDFEASISCVCEHGLAVISGPATNVLQTFTPNPEETADCSEAFTDTYGFGHDEIIRSVVQHLTSASPPAITYDDGVKSLQLLHALYKSDELNGWVKVDEHCASARLGIKALQMTGVGA